MVLRQPVCARIIIELGFDISFVFLLSRSSLTKLNISKENARRERKKERKEEATHHDGSESSGRLARLELTCGYIETRANAF